MTYNELLRWATPLAAFTKADFDFSSFELMSAIGLALCGLHNGCA
jgi:hypothetical protein